MENLSKTQNNWSKKWVNRSCCGKFNFKIRWDKSYETKVGQVRIVIGKLRITSIRFGLLDFSQPKTCITCRSQKQTRNAFDLHKFLVFSIPSCWPLVTEDLRLFFRRGISWNLHMFNGTELICATVAIYFRVVAKTF